MNDSNVQRLYTTEELLAMPDDDGVDRELIRGELREEPVTIRNRSHCGVSGKLVFLLLLWLQSQKPPLGAVLVGEAAFRLRRDPDTVVGIDVAYISPELNASTPEDARIMEGVPTLAVEVLTPSDSHKKVMDKVQEYLAAGVPLVWVVDPRFATVTVYRPDGLPQMFNRQQQIDAEPHLPGFKAAVADIFAR